MASLAEIRAKLREQENKASGNSSGGDNGIYPFWNLKEGQESLVRFLPDGNQDNTFFWAERLMIKLPFNGVKGESDSKSVQVQVPCVEMWGETCPILSEVRGWFKDKSLEDMGRKYWKKKSYLFQGLIVEDGMKEESVPENAVRRFILGPQLFQIVRSALLDPDMEELPTDYTNGVDFRICKTSKGGYADYSTSKWARRERPLSDDEIEKVNKAGLFNLSEYLPKKPSEIELKVIKEMFEASVDGEAFNKEKWGQYYRPSGMASETGDPVAKTAALIKSKATEPTTAETTEAVESTENNNSTTQKTPASTSSEPKASGESKASDILAMIRNRQQKN
jgi:hypothetical protein